MEESKRFYATRDIRKKYNTEKNRILKKYKKQIKGSKTKLEFNPQGQWIIPKGGVRTTLEKEILKLKKKLQ